MKLKSLSRLVAILSLIVFTVGCDQVSKKLVRNHISRNELIQVVPQKVILTNVENPGAAMSMGANLEGFPKLVLLKLLPLFLVLAIFVYVCFQKKLHFLTTSGLSLIIGGGLANLYDRFLFGSVTDFLFIDLGFIRTGIFNVADVLVFVGVLLVVFKELNFKKMSLSSSS